MTAIPNPSLARAYRLQYLVEAEERLTRIIIAQQAVLELAEAQGDEQQSQSAQVELLLNVTARAKAREDIERMAQRAISGVTLRRQSEDASFRPWMRRTPLTLSHYHTRSPDHALS